MKFKIPKPLKLEHEELHMELARAVKEGGRIGNTARNVAKILHPHFMKEEEYALPPLGVLSLLVKGQVVPEIEIVLKMTDRLKKELPQMLEEHKAIVAELKKLVVAAKKGNKTEYAHFAGKLILHAQTEEKVLYPTSILIGEYLRLKRKIGKV